MITISLALLLTVLPIALLSAFVILEGGLSEPQLSRCRHRRPGSRHSR
jgi:hypothetical protein